ncbi:fasciclin domain-containing protein [Paraflavisolibacter sp. H34]|uniref:fasciclin domain-containing protein n=1 Tax=Huijunlia imazamoxiresistens TaxID=3127457 RepID=UPI0030188615
MFQRNKKSLWLLAAAFAGVLYGCTKKWEDHNALTDEALKGNLAEAIGQTPGLAKFSELLVKSGYDKIIRSSKTFTVWAPSDSALQSLDAALLHDSAKLAQFVGNHISFQSYTTTAPAGRIQMLNGKYHAFAGSSFDAAQVLTANKYAANGVFHVINKALPRVDNIWELIGKTSDAPALKAYLQSLDRPVFDSSIATQISVDPLTGSPVYDTASGMSIRNSFLDDVMNVADESKEYTLFLLTDRAYTSETEKLKPWFKTSAGVTDTSARHAQNWLVKDLVFRGKYSLSQLPDTLVSAAGVKVPVNKSAITQTYQTSNGTVYVIDEMAVKLEHRFPPIYLQGENPNGFMTSNKGGNTTYRLRVNPVTGQKFNDIYMKDYGLANYWIRYNARNLPSMSYNVYWVAVNDVQTTPLYTQRLAVDSATHPTPFSKQIQYQNYGEELLGKITLNNYRTVPLYVVGPNSTSTTSGNTSITLDYIKLVPAF